jgi:hypothetical protein
MDREFHSFSLGSGAGIHSRRTLLSDGDRGVLVTPMEDVVAKDVGIHSECSHLFVLSGSSELAMLNRVSVVPPRVPLKCYFNSVNEHLGGFIAVAVAVHGETSFVV